MLVKGPRVTLRSMLRTDLAQMAAWRPFDDPLYDEANWPQRSRGNLDRWYARCSRDPKRLLFAVTDESGRLIGSITLRERDQRQSARLGITLGADFVDQGYGTEALMLFLDYYFEELGFEKIVLDVAGYNQRAIRVYQKLGFVTIDKFEQSFGWDKRWTILKESNYADVRKFFRRDWLARHWLLCYEMQLTREEWKARLE